MLTISGPAGAEAYQTYVNATGVGEGIGRAGPCTDIPCSGGRLCRCYAGQGRAKFYTQGSQLPALGGFKIEVSVDGTATRQSTACGCFIAFGYVTVATQRGTLRMPISGQVTASGSERRVHGAVPFRIAAQTAIAPGTGAFKESHGLGTVSAEFSDPRLKIVLDFGR